MEHARNFAAIHADTYLKVSEDERRAALVEYALPINVEKLESDLRKYRIIMINGFLKVNCIKMVQLQGSYNC